VERDDGEQGDREQGDLIAEQRDRLSRPKIAKGTIDP
jgi:hypothetical protein